MKAAGNTQTICDINSYKYTRTHTHSHAYLCFALRTVCIFICIFSCNYSLGHICSCISPRGHLLISRSICIVCRCCSLPLFLSLCPVSSVRVQHVNSFRISCSELVNILFVYFPNFPPLPCLSHFRCVPTQKSKSVFVLWHKSHDSWHMLSIR